MNRAFAALATAVVTLGASQSVAAQVVGAGPGPDLRAIYNPGPTYSPSVSRFNTLGQPYSPFVSGYAGYANAFANSGLTLYGPPTPVSPTIVPPVGTVNPLTGTVLGGANPVPSVLGGVANPFSNPLGSVGRPVSPYTGGTGFNQYPLFGR